MQLGMFLFIIMLCRHFVQQMVVLQTISIAENELPLALYQLNWDVFFSYESVHMSIFDMKQTVFLKSACQLMGDPSHRPSRCDSIDKFQVSLTLTNQLLIKSNMICPRCSRYELFTYMHGLNLR